MTQSATWVKSVAASTSGGSWRRRSSVGAALVAILMTVTACGGGVLASPGLTRPGFGTHATGTVNLWVRAATKAASVPIVAGFNKTHPGLRVVLTAIPDTQYVTKFSTAIRSDSVPDVVDIDDINSTLLAYHEALTDITTLARKLPYFSKLSPIHLNLATYDNRIYAVPFLADVSVLYYNKALFAKAGLDPSKPPTTLAQVLADARAITALGGGIKGYSFGGDSPGLMAFTGLPAVWASKDYLFRGKLGDQTAHVGNNAALSKFLQFYRDVWAGGYSSATSRTETGATWGKDFVAGKIGMWPGDEGALVAGGMTAESAKTFGAVALPGALSGSSAFVGGDNIAIPRGAKNASGAWEYIQYAQEIQQQQALASVGFTPVRSDANTAAFQAQHPHIAVALKALPRGYAEKTLAYNTAINQVSGPFFNLFTRAVFGGKVSSAVTGAQSGFDKALKQAQS